MEIDPDKRILSPLMPAKDPAAEKPSGPAFGEVLEEFVDSPKKVGTQACGIASIASKPDIRLNGFQTRGENPVIERAERLLDVLGEYQRKLADPVFTLRDISPLVQQLETLNTDLVPEIDVLADGDELKDIVSEVIIASTVEVVRFNRGDYVTP